MDNPPLSVKVVSFQEHFTVDISQTEPHLFDLTSFGSDHPSSFMLKGAFMMEAYCQAIIDKIRVLESSDISEFIEYQCDLMKAPMKWLDQLEKLISENYDFFEDNCHKALLHKLYVVIQFQKQDFKHKRKPLKEKLIDWSDMDLNDEVKFDFRQVKFDLSQLTCYEAKKKYLIELKADFLQSTSFFTPYPQKPFDSLIDIELDKLEQLKSIKLPVEIKAKVKNNEKIPICGNLNVFVDVFYQMLTEYKPEGVPYLSGSPTKIAEFIVDKFCDRDGNDIPLSTVRTLLSPGKIDKRPSKDKRIKLRSS